MTLDEWTRLTPGERNCVRLEWREGGDSDKPLEEAFGECAKLLEEACDRFRAQFLPHPQINYIDFSKCHPTSHEPSIVLTTALFFPQLLEELPDRYLTFRVIQQPIEDNKQFYLRTWKLVLGELLGWSEVEVREWARENYETGLDGKQGMFYHEDEFWYILPLLIPESLRSEIAFPEKQKLEGEMKQAILGHGSCPLWLSPYDWEGARNRINSILVRYGYCLSNE